jgi:hypothetical protein
MFLFWCQQSALYKSTKQYRENCITFTGPFSLKPQSSLNFSFLGATLISKWLKVQTLTA